MRIKEEKGSVAVVVIVAILFIVALSTTIYFAAVNRKNTGEETTREVKLAYEKDIENIDYVYASVISEKNSPNPPELKSNMELVKYENGNWVKDETNKNYSYIAGIGTEDNTKSEWANARVTIDGIESYFVWIPRYAYKITYYTDDTKTTVSDTNKGYGSIDVVFLKGKTDKYIDKDGNEKTAKRANQGGDPEKEYLVHPAFTNDVENGGWDKELTGIWVGKYETSLVDKETKQYIDTDNRTNINILLTEETNKNKAIAVQPNVSSCRNITIGNMYTNARYYSPNLESHMLKNSEWGAVAYLTHSQYGRNGTEITVNNNRNYITGIGGGSKTTYETTTETKANAYNTDIGMTASSTGNIYGIYDLSGGANEYVAAYYSGSSSLTNGQSFASQNGISTKYATTYDGITESSNYKKGDATYETKGWNLDYNLFLKSESPFLFRSGYANGKNSDSGVFNYSLYLGTLYGNLTFRMCLVVDTNETVEQNLYIYTKEQLEKFRDRVNSGETFEGKTVYLMEDINLNNGKYKVEDDGTVTFESTAEEWTPIGTDKTSFKGTFEGNNHTINGLYINNNSWHQGLFNIIDSSAIIKNLSVENGEIHSEGYVATIVFSNYGIVENCSSNVNVYGNNDIVGGIVATNQGKIIKCNNKGNIQSGWRVGGIVGSLSSGTIEECVNTGKVQSTMQTTEHANAIGGISGVTYPKSIINKCHNEGEIIGYYQAGGISGGGTDATITNCYNTGKVTATNQAGGGIIGQSGYTRGSRQECTIRNCFNSGEITGKEMIGGIAGCVFINIYNSYNIGTIKGENVENTGEIVSRIDYGILDKVYYLKNRNNIYSRIVESDVTVTNAEAKEENFMKSQEFVNLLGEENWKIEQGKNNGYPILK